MLIYRKGDSFFCHFCHKYLLLTDKASQFCKCGVKYSFVYRGGLTDKNMHLLCINNPHPLYILIEKETLEIYQNEEKLMTFPHSQLAEAIESLQKLLLLC